jgi:hypothetical protein
MGIAIALDELLATGWSGLDSSGCSFDSAGRAYPTVRRVQQEFASAGVELTITHVAAFDCYRAEWREAGGATMAGSTVSRSQEEAAVYALAQLRVTLAGAAAQQPPANHAPRKSKMFCTVRVPAAPLPPKFAYALPANQSFRKSKMSCTLMPPVLL